MGQEVQQFENALREYLGRPVVCVNTGTSALHLALQAAGVGPGDEVLVQSLTFVASFQAISATGARAIACDVVPESLTIDLQDATRRLNPRTKAIMPVHYSGGVGELAEVYRFAKSHGLRVIEDASHAFGTSYNQQRVGSFGDIACFSFDGIKNITSGEGGVIVTADETVLQLVEDARLLGVERDTEKRFSGSRSWSFDVSHQGWRYHMSNIMAAIGIEQLRRFPELSSRRQHFAQRYQARLAEIAEIQLLELDYAEIVPHIFALRLLKHDRSQIQQHLLEANIQTGFHYLPNHTLSLFRTDYPLPVTEEIFPQLLTLPLHPDLSDEQVDFVCQQLEQTLSTCPTTDH